MATACEILTNSLRSAARKYIRPGSFAPSIRLRSFVEGSCPRTLRASVQELRAVSEELFRDVCDFLKSLRHCG